MGTEAYLLKGVGGLKVEITMDSGQQVRKLINKLAEKIGAQPKDIRLQGPNGLIMIGLEDTFKLEECSDCPAITFRIGGFAVGGNSLILHR